MNILNILISSLEKNIQPVSFKLLLHSIVTFVFILCTLLLYNKGVEISKILFTFIFQNYTLKFEETEIKYAF